MTIKDVTEKTGLTKKAVAYYQERGLVAPQAEKNGYRSFSDADVERLCEIALLRRLGLSVEQVAQVLTQRGTLRQAARQRALWLGLEQRRLALLERYAAGEDAAAVEAELGALERSAAVRERLLLAFPGYFGRFLGVHIGRFLQEPVRTAEQESALQDMLRFLDEMEPLSIPEALRPLLEEAESALDPERMRQIEAGKDAALADFEAYWAENETLLKEYAAFRESEAYRSSPMAQLMEVFRRFCEASGYYEVFLPLLRRVSPAYDQYWTQLQEANEKLLRKLPQGREWYL